MPVLCITKISATDAWQTKPLRQGDHSRGAQRPAVLAKAAASMFGLTAAEAETVGLLVMGQSPDEIAAARGVQISTVRSLLKRAIAKSEVANLRELVAILAARPRG